MRTKFILFLLLFISAQIALLSQPNQRGQRNLNFSANGKITGLVADSLSKQPLEYANIVIFRKRDSSMVNGTITGNEGRFLFENLMPGPYYATLTYIGYNKITIDSIFIHPASPEFDLGTILLGQSSYQLGDVVISSEREAVINNLDKRVINVDKMITTAGGTALDVMQNIPSVSVNADGNISIRGNSNVTILIDGKPSALTGLSSTDVLTQIPSGSIESVELVTNPSARYDPDGTAGIINIVLKKRTNTGLNGLINLNAGTGSRYNSTFNMNYRTSDFNFFTNIDGRLNRFKRYGITNRTNEIPSTTSYLFQDQVGNNDMLMGNASIGADYLPDDFNTFSLSVQYRRFGMDYTGDISNFLYDQSQALTSYFVRSNDGERAVNSMTYNLGYKRTFSAKGKELTADIIYSHNKMNFDELITQRSFNTDLTPSGTDPYLQNSDARNRHNMLIAQSNFIAPFNDNSRIETGFKSSVRSLTMNFDYFNYDYSSGTWIPDPGLQDYFNHNEQIHAAYAIYTGRTGSLKYQGGLRAEQVLSDFEFSKGNNKFDKNYLSLYPSVFFAYEFGPGEEVRFNYSRRIDRPHPRRMNPYVNFSDSLNISYGNPGLDPEYINSLEAGYSTFIGKSNISSNLFYRHTDGLVSQISILRNDGVTETTFRNLTDGISYGVELTGSTEIFPWWRLNANYSFFVTEIKDASLFEGLLRKSDSWLAKLNSNFTLWEGILLQISGNYNSPVVTAQGRSDEVYFLDAALRKDFMKGDLSLTLRVSDIFDSRKFNSRTFGKGFTSTEERRFDSRAVFLGISYRINNFRRQADRERQMREDSEMDVF